jgi:ATP-binding cassette, subfamily B, bacterial
MNIPLSRYWELLVKYLRTQKKQFALLFLLLISSIGMQIFIPQITRSFIDTARSGAETSTLFLAGIAFIGVSLIQQMMAIGSVFVGENVAWSATNQLRSDLARHCLHLDMSYHNDHSPGELIERIDNDVVQLSNFFSQLVVRVIGNILLLVGILVVLFIEDWRVGIVFSVLSATSLFVLNRVRSVAVEPEKHLREAEADLLGFLEERLSGTEDIRSSGAVPFVIQRLHQLHQVILKRMKKTRRRHVLIWVAAGVVMTTGYCVALIAGHSLYTTGAMTIGTVYLVIQYLEFINRPVRELTQQVESLQNAGASIERIRDLLAVQPQITDGPGAVLPEGPLALRFENVNFRYREEHDLVLKDLDFSLKPGEVMGLLGRTGSGKTTIARLIFRLYEVTEGRVTVGDIDIKESTLSHLRQKVAMVTQDVQLFEATIRDNITFFDKQISDEQIMQVIEELELRTWFRTLPEGLDTKLETNGRSLSAGEAQLLAFTRVFLRNPGLVILDEASSRLDPATEGLIERAVTKLLHNRTGIIIAHRLGTIQHVDSIMILNDGQIMEHNSRIALASNPNSRFYHLLRTGLEEVLV